MTIDFSKPVETGNGEDVVILSTDGPNEEYPVVGYVEGELAITTWTKEGVHAVDLPYSGRDLQQVVLKKYHINVFPNPKSLTFCSGDVFESLGVEGPPIPEGCIARVFVDPEEKTICVEAVVGGYRVVKDGTIKEKAVSPVGGIIPIEWPNAFPPQPYPLPIYNRDMAYAQQEQE